MKTHYKNSLRLIGLFLSIFCFQVICISQTSLAIDKGGRVKRIHFYTGEGIIVKVKNEKGLVIGYIGNIEDSAVVMEGRRIKITQIEYIINPHGPYIWTLLSKVGIRGGLGYFVLDSGNRMIRGDSPIIDDHTFKVSIPILAVGIIATFIRYKKYRNNGSNIKVVKL